MKEDYTFYNCYCYDKDPIDFKLGHCNETLLLYNMCAWVSIGDPSAERGVWFL